MDYTAIDEFRLSNTAEEILDQLYTTNKKLSKLNRGMFILCCLGVGFTVVKYRKNIKKGIENMKGE